MKKVKVTYWITTGLISLMMLTSVYAYLTSEQVKGGFVHLGFPGYFRVELAVAKFLGLLVLIIPMVKGRVKEWAYFGFFITFVSALVAHVESGDAASVWAPSVVATVVLLISYLSYRKLEVKPI